jgi:hypothetical protein
MMEVLAVIAAIITLSIVLGIVIYLFVSERD